ncbi:MAG: M24 family metallopeptidase, partial [Ignavibacteriales bacterium]|nr:M24 family metallopeptidase [Ignavibacteriales bacterium]
VLSTARLETGNVFTIEPGVYIPGFGGVRIEDDVVIHNSQCEVLNRSPKELMIL